MLHAIDLLSKEIDRDMALLGIHSLDELNRDRLMRIAHGFAGGPASADSGTR